MSAPLVVNTEDGTCWTRREETRGGQALYAPEKCGKCPEFVMATYAELEGHGIAGSADALPMPVGPQMPEFPPPPETELEKLRAERARLQGLLAEAVADVHRARRERDLMRERVSEPFGCKHCGEAKRSHGRRWITSAGVHAWERPSDEQVKDRMLARRVARMALPSNLSLWEEEQTTARLRLEVAGRKAYGDRLKAENAGLTAELHEARKYIRAVEQLLAKRTPLSPRGQEAVLLAIKWLLDDRNEYRSRVDGAEKEARLTRARIAALLVEPTDPQACALCSVPEEGHGVRVDAGGFGLEHEWTRPMDVLVRERERMRRELERRAAGELPELALPWAHAMPDDDLRGFLDDLVSAALNRWRSEPDVPDRVTLAEIEKACAGWRTPGQGFRSDEPEVSADALTRTFLPVASLREDADAGEAGQRVEWCTGCNTDHDPDQCGYQPETGGAS